MGIIVSKFGGSSVADAAMFRRVLSIIESRRHAGYVILSAPGKRTASDTKITDLLCSAHDRFHAGEDYSYALCSVRERFTSIIRELGLTIDPDVFLGTLDTDIRHSRDYAASRGEYLCAKLFSEFSCIPFVDSAHLIHFDSAGLLLRDKTETSIRAMSKRLPCAVIPGFYGSRPDGEIQTFSRGGSDITGALVAASLNADVYENWTDVPGLLSGDPSLCPAPICHPAVSFRQMRALSLAGAHVLHPYCLEPVWEAGVPTVLRNTFSPEQPGTYISDCVRTRVPCVCTLDGFCAIRREGLCAQALAVSKDLPAYTDHDGKAWLALHTEVPDGISACIASIFGLPASMSEQAERISSPIAMRREEDCIRFLIHPGQKQETVRKLHRLLTAARTP